MSDHDLPGMWEKADFDGGQDHEVRGPHWVPNTAHVPLRNRPLGSQTKTQPGVFIVTCVGTEPPPEWLEDTLKVLRRETKFCLGNSARVEVFPEGASVEFIGMKIREMLDDASQPRQ